MLHMLFLKIHLEGEVSVEEFEILLALPKQTMKQRGKAVAKETWTWRVQFNELALKTDVDFFKERCIYCKEVLHPLMCWLSIVCHSGWNFVCLALERAPDKNSVRPYSCSEWNTTFRIKSIVLCILGIDRLILSLSTLIFQLLFLEQTHS